MDELIKLIKKANFIWICGNGGSASTAEHFANDLLKKGYSAIALSSNTSTLTMIANDYGYNNIFSKQLEVYASGDDLVITISCSGKSKNILKVLDLQEKIGFSVYRFNDFSNFKNEISYGKLEDKHLEFVHKVIENL